MTGIFLSSSGLKIVSCSHSWNLNPSAMSIHETSQLATWRMVILSSQHDNPPSPTSYFGLTATNRLFPCRFSKSTTISSFFTFAEAFW